jgi:deoxyadenosine/deoxycytidine kinase
LKDSCPYIYMRRQTPVYIVEGEIAAGKSELVGALARELATRGLSACTVLEPVERWKEVGILQKFYSDPARHAYGFQTYVNTTRILEIVSRVEANPLADLFILERSPATDAVFMEMQRQDADPVEMKMYEEWCALYARLLPIDLSRAKVLYLKTSLSCCMRRLAARGREGEIQDTQPETAGTPTPSESAAGGVSAEYQAKLRRAHEAFLHGLHTEEFPDMKPSPFARGAVIDIPSELADGDFRADGIERDRIVSAIIDLMGIRNGTCL